MDDVYLTTAMRYLELNPVKAQLVERPELWKFSSASAYVHRTEDRLAKPPLLNEKISDWKDFLSLTPSEFSILFLTYSQCNFLARHFLVN